MSLCKFTLPAIPTPPIAIPLGDITTALALLAALEAALEALAHVPLTPFCPLD